MTLDIDFVRAQFPAFAQPALADCGFFENAGGSYPCRQVVDRLTGFYAENKVQPYAPYAASRVAGEQMDEARRRMAGLLNVAPEDLSFGPSTTQNTYVLARAFGEMLGEGDAIIVTDQDHEANTGPWRRLAARGIEIREWQVDRQSGRLDPAALAPLMEDGKAKLLCFPHCSNILAEINDVAAICDAARRAGLWTCVDGVSHAPHGLPDIAALGADIYLFSAYKTYGPHQGVMAVKRDLAMRLPNQAHEFNGDVPYKRLTPAGPDHAQVAAMAGLADYMDLLFHHHAGEPDPTGTPAHERAARVAKLMRDHETAILQPLLDHLSSHPKLRLLGPVEAARRAPTVAVAADEPGADLAARLAKHGIMAGGGDFYAPRLLRALGIDPERGVLRLSFVHYTSAAEVDRLISALDHVA